MRCCPASLVQRPSLRHRSPLIAFPLSPDRYIAHEDSAWVTVAPGPLPAIKIRLDRTGGARPNELGGNFPDFLFE
jgi:hypothetical protein